MRSLLFPVMIILILGNLGNTSQHVPIVVVNYDNSPASINFINLLQAHNILAVVSATNQQDAIAQLAAGKVSAVVVIPAGFSTLGKSTPNVIAYVDTSSPVTSGTVLSTINSVAASFGSSIVTKNLQGRVASTSSSAGTFTIATDYSYGASANYKTFLVAGTLIMVAAFGSIFSGGFSIITARQLGNLKAFLASPVNKLAILMSKMGYGVAQSMLGGGLALVVGVLLGGSIYAGISGVPVILWFIFLCGLAFAGVSTALAIKINKIETYALISQTIVMPLYFLSGAFTPTSTLPGFLQVISAYDPMTYGVNGVRDVMLKGAISPSAFWLDTGVLVLFAAIALGLSLWLFRQSNDNV
ncbi:ABC-2 family transporter protein [uncultured archaeon]|nr:ABC-2 family transporter protein [uncultured archaeon]